MGESWGVGVSERVERGSVKREDYLKRDSLSDCFHVLPLCITDHVFNTFSALAGLETRSIINPFLASGGVAL